MLKRKRRNNKPKFTHSEECVCFCHKTYGNNTVCTSCKMEPVATPTPKDSTK